MFWVLIFDTMKVKDIIKIQYAISEAIDFIATNSDGDETSVGVDTLTILSESRQLLQNVFTLAEGEEKKVKL